MKISGKTSDIRGVKLPDHWFYGSEVAGSSFSFEEDEMRHATKALRLKVGDEIQWTDGFGGRFIGEITSIDRKSMNAWALNSSEEESPQALILGVGVLHDATRLEWLIEKATELGATGISIIQAERSERPKHKMRRLQAKALSAMKQSGRAWLPLIIEQSLDEFLESQTQGVRLIAHCYEQATRILLSEIAFAEDQRKCLLIGPEGDFTPQEITKAEETGFTAVSLGNARFRTETAALVGLSRMSMW